MRNQSLRSSRERRLKVSSNNARSAIRRVVVFGSGTVKDNSSVYKQAVTLGIKLAKEGFHVYHGGYGGVMEAVARGVKGAGGYNAGVTIGKSLNDANPWAEVAIKMPSWQKRLFKLIEKGEAYVFLDGATGTLNELFFVWEMANNKLHKKPMIILGRQLRRLVRLLKKDPSLRIPGNFHLASSISEAIKILIRYRV